MSLQQGSTGPDVAILQQNLAQVGFTNVADDGIYGPITAAAVKAWQRDQREVETGSADDYDISQIAKGVWAGYTVPQDIQEYAIELASSSSSTQANGSSSNFPSTYVPPNSDVAKAQSPSTLLLGLGAVGAGLLLFNRKGGKRRRR